jgi:hypothetical protein
MDISPDTFAAWPREFEGWLGELSKWQEIVQWGLVPTTDDMLQFLMELDAEEARMRALIATRRAMRALLLPLDDVAAGAVLEVRLERTQWCAAQRQSPRRTKQLRLRPRARRTAPLSSRCDPC